MSKAFHPLVLRVPVYQMRVGLTSKSKFVLVKKSPLSSYKLYPSCFLHFREISNALPFVFLHGTLQSQFNRHFLNVCYPPKHPVLACGRREAHGRIVFSGRRVDKILFGSLRYHFKRQQLPSREKRLSHSFL